MQISWFQYKRGRTRAEGRGVDKSRRAIRSSSRRRGEQGGSGWRGSIIDDRMRDGWLAGISLIFYWLNWQETIDTWQDDVKSNHSSLNDIVDEATMIRWTDDDTLSSTLTQHFHNKPWQDWQKWRVYKSGGGGEKNTHIITTSIAQYVRNQTNQIGLCCHVEKWPLVLPI